MKEWTQIPAEYTKKLVVSIPNWLEALVISKCYHTKYQIFKFNNFFDIKIVNNSNVRI